MSQSPQAAPSVSTGIKGLDHILGGGFTPNRLYLLEGEPGSGKTTMGLQFLLAGVQAGETVLYVTLSETRDELLETAASHGWSLDGIHIHELLPMGDQLDPESQYTMFHPSEVELGETTGRMLQEVERLQPTRVVFDSLAEIRLMAGTMLRFRRQVLALKQYFAGRHTTVLLLDDANGVEQGAPVHTIVHGAVMLSQMRPDYGGDRRRLRIGKLRGRPFIGGYHDYEIRTGGVELFPRLVASHIQRAGEVEQITSNLAELDALLGGGLDRGTSVLLMGAAGVGKSSLATHFVMAAAERGERSALFLFDESVRTLMTRSHGMGFPLQQQVDEGRVSVESVDPGEISPGEFIQRIRNEVENHGARLVMIDSLSGYFNAMSGEKFVLIQLHELLAYLAKMGVVTLLINAQKGLIGRMSSDIDVSYLADTVILLRYFEAEGQVRQALSVLKKRTGAHERTIRELTLTAKGVRVGEPLRDFAGVLTGVPHPVGAGRPGNRRTGQERP